MSSHLEPIYERPESKRTIIGRATIFALVLVYIVGGPFYKQVLKGKSTAFHEWRMFHTMGLGVCDAEFFVRYPDGNTQILDRFEALGYEDRFSAPIHIRRLIGEQGVLYVGQLIRNKLGDDVDLRVKMRIATHKGWETLAEDRPIE